MYNAARQMILIRGKEIRWKVQVRRAGPTAVFRLSRNVDVTGSSAGNVKRVIG